jgi:hypothetical protein
MILMMFLLSGSVFFAGSMLLDRGIDRYILR